MASDKIKVVVRVRGLIAREKEQPKCICIEDSTEVIQKSTKKKWTFDRLYLHLEDNRFTYPTRKIVITSLSLGLFTETLAQIL